MERELRILMLEDQEDDAGLVDRALKRERMHFTRLRVDTKEEFTHAIENFRPDVILSDHSLPHFNSIEALKICQAKKLNIPFILVTGAVSEEFAVNCLKRGADDYVLKSNLSRLPLAIRYALRQHRFENNRQVQEELLRKQNDELTKINKELDLFVYSVSHDLRSPLSSILGLVNVARMEAMKSYEVFENYLDMIERSVMKLDLTLREILDYSRNARGELITTETNLAQLINDTFEQLAHVNGYDQIKRQIDIQGHTAFYSDSYRLSVILSNLISNAIKYRDEYKKPTLITISATITPAHCTMTIQDNGIGIHPKYLGSVFKMFYRASDRSQGAGLGLYIVKEMVEKLEGKIMIESTLGHGTIISLSIPNNLMKLKL